MEDKKELIHAAKPTLFEATFHPDLIINVMFANFMSEKLDELGHHAIHTPGPFASETELTHALTRLFKYMNGRFYHARPVDFAKIWGLHERENIHDPEALEANDYTIHILSEAYHHVEQFKPYAHLLEGFLETGLFPEYVYPTADIILQLAQKIPPMENHPAGMTSCADECILIASLAFIRHCCNLEDFVILGSPLHYILFIFPEGSEGYLFNGKREFFTASSWADACGEKSPAAIRDAFLGRIFTFDRLITLEGSCIFPLRRGSISKGKLISSLERIRKFLGIDLQELIPDIPETIQVLHPDSSPDLNLLMDLNWNRTPENMTETIRKHMNLEHNSIALRSCYTARWKDVPEPEVYVQAALTGYKTWLLSAEVLDLQDAIDLVRQIPGRVSIFGSNLRIALPDEVLLFQTAGKNERVLLLYSLLMLSEAIPEKVKLTFQIFPETGKWVVEAFGEKLSGEDL